MRSRSKLFTGETTKSTGDDIKIQLGELQMYCADLKIYIPDWPKSTGMTEQVSKKVSKNLMKNCISYLNNPKV